MADQTETLPTPSSEDVSKTSFDEDGIKEALDLNNNETLVETEHADADDKVVSELTKTDRVAKSDDYGKQTTKEEITSTVKQAAEAVQTAIDDGASKDDVEDLKKQLAFYQTLFGDVQPQAQQQQQNNNQTQQNNQQQTQQQQANILDIVDFSDEELLGLLSGDKERALPVVKKFVATAVVLATQNFQQQQQMQERTGKYIDGVQKVFYEKYGDLDEFREIVKFAGDQIHQENLAKGINKYPHEIIDDVGKRARQIKEKYLAKTNNTNGNGNGNGKPKQVIKQGEVGSTKVVPPPKEQLTNEQKEMYDLIDS